MRTKKNIVFLIENGLSINTVSKMTDSQVKVLVEKFKKETKEEWQKKVSQETSFTAPVAAVQGLTLPQGAKKISVSGDTVEVKETEMTEELEVYNDPNKETETQYPKQVGPSTDDGNNNYTDGMAESEINEKFQSKSQQGLFWARCNKCSSKNCKWCKMAKEFSDSTSKKDYKKMPKKKRPKKTNESSQKYWENKILEMLEEEKKRRKKTPKKESETMILRKPKKMTMFSDEAPMELPIAKMFSIGKK
jgi:hypothetical protein